MCSDSQLFATPWTVVSQTPLSMGVSRQKHWSGLPFPSPGDLPDPGIEPGSAAFQADSLLSEPPGKSKNFIFLSFPPECYLFKAMTVSLVHYRIPEPKGEPGTMNKLKNDISTQINHWINKRVI